MSDLQSFVLICDFSRNKCTFAGVVNSAVVLLRFDETLWIGNNVDRSLRCSRRQQKSEFAAWPSPVIAPSLGLAEPLLRLVLLECSDEAVSACYYIAGLLYGPLLCI